MNSGTYKTDQLDDNTSMAVTKAATDRDGPVSPPEIPTEASPDSEKVRSCESLTKTKLQEPLCGTVGDRSVSEDIICKDEAAVEQHAIDDADDVAFEWLDEVSLLTDELVDTGLEHLCVVFPELGLQDDVEGGSYEELLPDSVELTKWRRKRRKSESTTEAK